jgi:hypothetical protein
MNLGSLVHGSSAGEFEIVRALQPGDFNVAIGLSNKDESTVLKLLPASGLDFGGVSRRPGMMNLGGISSASLNY